MARIVYILGELKGSIGDLTFQQNSSGKIVRLRPRKNRSSTTSQQRSHLLQNNLLQGWQLLTLVQKNSWNAYAGVWLKTNKFGQDKKLTGQNWFTSLNYYRGLLSLSLFTLPPAHDLPTAPPSFEIVLSDSSISIEFTSSHNYIDSPVIVWVTIPSRKNTNSINQIRKFAIILDTDPGTTLDITTEWETATGINWTPTITFPNANIFVCLESVKASSGITSSMICKKENTADNLNEEETLIYYA